MAYYTNRNGSSFFSNVPTVTRTLLVINIIMFVATLINEDFMIEKFALFYPTSYFFRWWQPLSHMFMHGGFWHIFFNMYTLLMFGSIIERTIGEKKFLILYFVCGFGAVLLHLGVQYLQIQNWMAAATPAAQINITNLLRTPTVGASGAIYGLLIAFAMLNPDAVLTLIFPPIPLKAKWWVIIFAAIELLTGMTGTVGGVAHFAHLGGMLFGLLLILYWRKKGTLWKR